MLQSGSGLPPGSPLQGQGVRQADSRALCLPRRRSDGYPLYCGRSAYLPYVIFRFPRNPRQTGVNCGLSLWGGVTTLPVPEESAKPRLRLQIWPTGSFLSWAVPQGTQGTQESRGGFLRHLRHFRHWSVYCTSTSRWPLLR